MTSDKPKHKPNTKHTLEEVLKSLHDLIRNDLVSADATAAKLVQPPSPAAPADTEPDDFNTALDKLDAIITNDIIEPVERARHLPPAPPEIVEPDEIPWDEQEPLEQESADAEPTPEDEDIILESIDDTSELDTVPADGIQEAFSFNPSAPPDADDESPKTPPSFEAVNMNGARAEPTISPEISDTPAAAEEWDVAATVEFSVSPQPTESLPDSPAVPPENIFDVDLPSTEPAAAPSPPAPPPAAEAPPPAIPEQTLVDAAAELRPPPLFAEPAPAAIPSEPLPIIQEPAPKDDIPVLNEVAHEVLAQVAGAAAPSPERIREITIQIAARLNIELRQSGGQPLDARTINRLQQLLLHALSDAPKNHNRG